MSSIAKSREAYIHSPRTLNGLPPELRLEIFKCVFSSTTLYVKRGPITTECCTTLVGEYNESGGNTYVEQRAKRRISVAPSVPERLNLVCRLFNDDIGGTWHSMITYHFASTVAFIDVLSQWPEEKVQRLKNVTIVGTPLPLYHWIDEGVYSAFLVDAALPIFPGLCLDCLTVENIWLQPNGEEVDGWCLGATHTDVSRLLVSKGWKELRYLSGVLGLTPRESRELSRKIEEKKTESGEEDFEYFIGRVRPQLSGLETRHPDGTVTDADSDEDKAEVAQWWKDHPEEPKEALPEDVEKEIVVKAVRGKKSNYKQDGSELETVIKELLQHMSWVELRATDDYLVDDGVDDSWAHL